MRDATSYRAIAPFYDWIMAHVDYDAWGRHLGRLWRRFGNKPSRFLELGAGTCPFSRRKVFPPGAKVVYSDLSPFMLTYADPSVQSGRVAANALSLPFKATFDAVLMVYDAFNYLMTEEDAVRCLSEVRRVLAPGGVFIFDVTTEANSRKHFEDLLDFGELEGCTYVRESRYDREARLQLNAFTFFVEKEPGSFAKVKESHQQRIYRLSKLKALARKAGFTVEGCFDGFTLEPGGEESERIHFVLRNPSPAGKKPA
jgi:ubiquinone/menaquinone biosynthesis C-methylase UbiE